MSEPLRTLELFAGIGGLALAAPPALRLVAAYDQDEAAARTHRHNLGVPVHRLDLATVSEGELRRHDAEAWLLGPPCQPFTRRGRQRDVDDRRCAGLLRLVELLPRCRPRRVLVENVPGFFGSRAHGLLRAALERLGHAVREVEACPSDAGAPVRRRRQFLLSSADGLSASRLVRAERRDDLERYLDPHPSPELRVPPDVRRRVEDRLPVAGRDGVLGTFTRSYGHAISGAGPVRWEADGPRYFSPEEILRLHAFPREFAFPPGLDRATRWRLAGNSVHVSAVRGVAAALEPEAA